MKNPFLKPERTHAANDANAEKDFVALAREEANEIKKVVNSPGFKHFEKILLNHKANDEWFFRQMPTQEHYSVFVGGGYKRITDLLEAINRYKS